MAEGDRMPTDLKRSSKRIHKGQIYYLTHLLFLLLKILDIKDSHSGDSAVFLAQPRLLNEIIVPRGHGSRIIRYSESREVIKII